MLSDHDIQSFKTAFLTALTELYSRALYEIVCQKPELQATVPGFLIAPDEIIIYIGQKHVGVEYLGSDVFKHVERPHRVRVRVHDLTSRSGNILEAIVGFEFDSPRPGLTIPLSGVNEGLLFATNRGWDELDALNYDYFTESTVLLANASCPQPTNDEFIRIVNGMFFDAGERGLKVRRIKWLELLPIIGDVCSGSFDVKVTPLVHMLLADAQTKFPQPHGFDKQRLARLNRFIEIWADKDTRETQITSFLEQPENSFIIKSVFGAKDAKGQLTGEWQSEERDAVRPDFFIIKPNGFADILEFKLPSVEGKVIVGQSNRESFGAWLVKYISQTRTYAQYFDDPNNRAWFEQQYGLKVYKPRRILVVGRRADFVSNVWKEIASDFRDIEVINFDDFVDGAFAQLYN